MKRTLQCPKCVGRRFWVVERYRMPGPDGGWEAPVVSFQREAPRIFGIPQTSEQGRVDLWVCETCGYTELWARDLAGIREDPERGVRRVDAAAEPEGPFR